MSWLGNRYPDLLPSLVILRKPLDEISDDRAENNLGVHMQCGAAAIGGHSHSVSTRPIVPPSIPATSKTAVAGVILSHETSKVSRSPISKEGLEPRAPSPV